MRDSRLKRLFTLGKESIMRAIFFGAGIPSWGLEVIAG
jgi:hypothetical protein